VKRIAIVVQRCHPSVVGGSESLAWQYATTLKQNYDVEILTTTALDIATWQNILPEGRDDRDGVKIRRFAVTIGRTPYWHQLHVRLADDFAKLSPDESGELKHLPWPIPLQEEFIARQGPFSEPLIDFLRQEWNRYASIIFMTYLYPTTYFGSLRVPRGRFLLAPTLHFEAPAFLSVYKYAAERARSIIWLTEGERRLGERLWGSLPGRVVPIAISTDLHEGATRPQPYVLYSGRIDINKNCAELFDYFLKFKREHPSGLRLLLIGKQQMAIPRDADIEFLGFVSEEEKFRLMAGATALIMPSKRESLSIVTLEALSQRTPVLADAGSEVTADHLTESRAGFLYHDHETFAAALNKLLADAPSSLEMGARGRKYVTANYAAGQMRERLLEMIQDSIDNSDSLPACSESQGEV
jgi:glycosyltransferase involved in cell wall biosynthesis